MRCLLPPLDKCQPSAPVPPGPYYAADTMGLSSSLLIPTSASSSLTALLESNETVDKDTWGHKPLLRDCKDWRDSSEDVC